MAFQVKNQQEFDKLTRKVKVKSVTKGTPKPIIPEFLNDWHKETEKLKAKIHRLEKANERLTKENEAFRLIIQHKISQEALLERYPDLKFIKE
jgi:hypothetical protein